MDGAAPCPCGSPLTFDRCCGRYLGGKPAPTAEALMRSRFSAFAVRDARHLLRTWHADTRPPTVRFVPGQRWVRLEVLATVDGNAFDADGMVEFRAHHQRNGVAGVLHELSRFVRDEENRWVYLGAVEADLA